MNTPLIIFDSEYTAWEGSRDRQWSNPNEHREIVQIGAIKINHVNDLNEIEHFNVLVKPKINHELSEYFTELTGITQPQIENLGINFTEALNAFTDFVGTESKILSNGGDESIFTENCEIHNIEFKIKQHRFVNLAKYFMQLADKPHHIDTCDLVKTFNVIHKQSAHDALSDTRSILAVLNFLVKNKQHHKQFLALFND